MTVGAPKNIDQQKLRDSEIAIDEAKLQYRRSVDYAGRIMPEAADRATQMSIASSLLAMSTLLVEIVGTVSQVIYAEDKANGIV